MSPAGGPHVALYEPEIPGNAGAIARLCAATATPLHLIGRLGFSLRHPAARRAAMDYWEQLELHRHLNYQAMIDGFPGQRVIALSTRGTTDLWDFKFSSGDTLLFGPESRGLPEDLLDRLQPATLRIPMMGETRSLNLSTAAAIALYEALRQLNHPRATPLQESL